MTIRGGGWSNFKKIPHELGELELAGNSSQNSPVVQHGPAKSAGLTVAKASKGAFSQTSANSQ